MGSTIVIAAGASMSFSVSREAANTVTLSITPESSGISFSKESVEPEDTSASNLYEMPFSANDTT
jgi:hypothetical protein